MKKIAIAVKTPQECRKKILEIIHASGSSHIGSAFSMVEIITAVYNSVDIDKIRLSAPDRDRVIVSKGHSATALYTALWSIGLISDRDLNTYGMNGSLFSGHVSHFVPFVEHSTGALGHGLPVSVGVALGLRSAGHDAARVYCIVGDGEMQEGSNWEALMLASHCRLANLCVLIDNNGLGGIGSTDSCCSLKPCKERLKSFGFHVLEVDGHDLKALAGTIAKSRGSGCPSAIICNTVKGKGVSFMEKNNVWHYRPPNKEEYQKALEDLDAGRAL